MGRERDDWTDERSENADPSGEARKHPPGEVRDAKCPNCGRHNAITKTERRLGRQCARCDRAMGDGFDQG
jgi:hypothetical protein